MNGYLSFNQIANLIMAVGAKRTVIVEGPFGIGKTAIESAMRRAAQSPTHPLHNHIFTGVLDCTQLSDGSIWMPDIDKEMGVSRELPNERFGVHRQNQKGVNGSRPVVIMADEMAKASQFVKNMLAPIFYERRIGGYHFPEGSIVFGATNMAIEGLGDSIQPHLRNRIITVKMRPPTMEEWVNNFAVPNGLSEELIAAAHTFPQIFDSFIDYHDGGKYAGKDLSKSNAFIYNPKLMGAACVTPRSLHAASDLMIEAKEHNLDDDTLQAGLAGTVGEPFAKEMLSFIRFGREIPSFEEIVAKPLQTAVPDNPTAQIVQVFQFIARVQDTTQADAVVQYVQRMQSEMQALFARKVSQTSGAASNFAKVKAFGTLLKDCVELF
jgi:hypothetical protein